MSGDIDGLFSYPLDAIFPQNLGDVLLTLGWYLLDIISPTLGWVPESSNWTVLSFFFFTCP